MIGKISGSDTRTIPHARKVISRQISRSWSVVEPRKISPSWANAIASVIAEPGAIAPSSNISISRSTDISREVGTGTTPT